MAETTPRRTRRRGAALDHALLAAAWEELLDHGYEGFTMDAVADRAKTSRTVLYRRWADRDELVLATMEHWQELNPVAVPDTGSLRDDLVVYLEQKATMFGDVATRVMRRLRELKAVSVDVRERLTQAQVAALDAIWQQAGERGEVDLDALTSRVRMLPLDLLRAEVSTTEGSVPRAAIEDIVDTVVLPLVHRR